MLSVGMVTFKSTTPVNHVHPPVEIRAVKIDLVIPKNSVYSPRTQTAYRHRPNR